MLAITILLTSSSLAASPLKANLRLKSMENQLKDETLNNNILSDKTIKTKLGSKLSLPLTQPQIQNTLREDPPDPVFIDLKKPFTASPYYDFVDNFLLGLKLETYFEHS